jgi:hypothetical protein
MIKVAFLHVGPLHAYEPRFVDSVLTNMPFARIVQFTDLESPEVPGIHEVRRSDIKTPLWVHRWRAYSELEGDVVCLDTDVIVQRDLGKLFAFDWDIALTRRDKPVYDPNKVDITKTMPFNGGVLLSRSPRWLASLASTCEEINHLNQEWYTDQLAMAVCVRSQKESCLHLPCEVYNFTPNAPRESVSHAWVVHYKGKRKEWMCH